MTAASGVLTPALTATGSPVPGLSSAVLLYLFIGLSETLLVYYAFSALLKRNDRPWKYYVLALAVYMGCTIFDAVNNFKVYFVLIFCYLLITALSFLFYEDPYEIRFTVPFIFVALNYSATIFSSTLQWYLANRTLASYPVNLRQNVYSQLLLCLIFIAYVELLNAIRRLSVRHVWLVRTTLYVIFPLATLIALIRMLYLAEAPTSASIFLQDHLLIGAVLFLFAMTLFVSSDGITKMHEASERAASLEQMLGVQEKYYEAMKTHQQELRRISHDIKNHNRTISGLIDQGRYREAAEYADSLVIKTSESSPVTDCRNVLVAALLNDKLGKLEEKGIKVTTCVMVPEVMTVKDIDVSILLGNLLDNAVEACLRDTVTAEKFIDLDMRLKGPLLVITVRNSYSGELNTIPYPASGESSADGIGPGDDGREYFLTTKPDPHFHGIGLTNIRRAAERYNGRLTLSHDDRVFTATVRLFYPAGEISG